jgi:hypothetical protein
MKRGGTVELHQSAGRWVNTGESMVGGMLPVKFKGASG